MRALIFLLILSISGYLWHYRRERYQEFEGLQSAIKNAEGSIHDRQKEKDMVLERLKPLRESKKEVETPEGSPELLQKEVDALKDALNTSTAQLDTAESEFLEAMNAVREQAKKQTFPVLKLASGKELKNASVTKFTESFVMITHSDGVDKVQTEDLPADWVKKYSLDYVSRDSQADKDMLKNRVQAATTAPLNLKNAKVSDIKARITDLEGQLLALAAEMREARRKSDQLVRDAYRIAMEKGAKGQVTVAKRTALFDQSKKVESGRSEIQLRYKKLREEKLDLERQLVEMSKRPGT